MTKSVFEGLPTVQTGTRGRPAVDWSAVIAERVEDGKALTFTMSGDTTAASTMSRLRRTFAETKVRGVKAVHVSREGCVLTVVVEPTTQRVAKTTKARSTAKATAKAPAKRSRKAVATATA